MAMLMAAEGAVASPAQSVPIVKPPRKARGFRPVPPLKEPKPKPPHAKGVQAMMRERRAEALREQSQQVDAMLDDFVERAKANPDEFRAAFGGDGQ